MAGSPFDARQTTILKLFQRSTDGRLSAGDIKRKLGLGSKKGRDERLDAPEAGRALAGLIEEGIVAVTGGAKDGHHPRPKASYRLTDKGRQHLRPPRPDFPDELLQGQEAFILLQVFRAKEQTLTRSELKAKLKTKAAMENLEFDENKVPATVDYHLATLVEKDCLDERRRGVSVIYSLNPERGARALASIKQHQTATFTMNGETLNALLAAARDSGPVQAGLAESPSVDHPADVRPAPTSLPLGPDDIARYVEQLRSDRFAGKNRHFSPNTTAGCAAGNPFCS